MSSFSTIRLVLALSFSWLICVTGIVRADDLAAHVDAAKKATALVEIKTDKAIFYGSAFCIDAAEGIFITNNHVIRDAKPKERILMVLNGAAKNQRKIYATLLKTDATVDLAILKVKDAPDLTALDLGDDQTLVETAPIAAFGYPLGTLLSMREGQYPAISVNMGHVSALRRDQGRLTFIQLDALVNPGNSGGPVLNEKGQVVGVIRLAIDGAEGINYAIPISEVVSLLRKSQVVLTPNILPPAIDEEIPGDKTKSAETVKKSPPPTAAALAKADETLKTLYASDLKTATTPAGRRTVSQKLINDAAKLEGDPAGQFAALEKGRLLAVEAGELKLALEGVGSIAKYFTVNGVVVEADTLTAIAPKVVKPEENALLASRGMSALEGLLKAEQYDKAGALATIVQSAAVKSRNKVVKAQAATRVEFAQAVCEEYKKVKPSIDALHVNPKSAPANAAVGYFKCIYRGEWSEGLPLMAAGKFGGSDQMPLTDLAARDVKDPDAAPQQAELAAAWWDYAEKQPPMLKGRLQSRAAYWYRKALPKLTGLDQNLAQRRLATVSATASASGNVAAVGEDHQVIDLLQLVDPARDAIAGGWEMKDGTLVCGGGNGATLRFPYQVPTEYDLTIEFSQKPGDWSSGVILSKNGKSFDFGIGGSKEGAGVHFSQYGKKNDLKGASAKDLLEANRRYVTRIEVREKSLKAFVDDRLTCSCHPDYKQFEPRPWYAGDHETIGLVSFYNVINVYRAEVTEITGVGTVKISK